ncbi:hypothetical protein EVAR_74984_1 [Eumeta japonica]|uniref:Uncharacterized protein n=1 Tax=Eumeta variegata TaxID=151549 RepID=A0A4C1VAP1_EUMVA|nr:hypothetical protein EVAR_74984_1 [Eumeta japonica]
MRRPRTLRVLFKFPSALSTTRLHIFTCTARGEGCMRFRNEGVLKRDANTDLRESDGAGCRFCSRRCPRELSKCGISSSESELKAESPSKLEPETEFKAEPRSGSRLTTRWRTMGRYCQIFGSMQKNRISGAVHVCPEPAKLDNRIQDSILTNVYELTALTETEDRQPERKQSLHQQPVFPATSDVTQFESIGPSNWNTGLRARRGVRPGRSALALAQDNRRAKGEARNLSRPRQLSCRDVLPATCPEKTDQCAIQGTARSMQLGLSLKLFDESSRSLDSSLVRALWSVAALWRSYFFTEPCLSCPAISSASFRGLLDSFCFSHFSDPNCAAGGSSRAA